MGTFEAVGCSGSNAGNGTIGTNEAMRRIVAMVAMKSNGRIGHDHSNAKQCQCW